MEKENKQISMGPLDFVCFFNNEKSAKQLSVFIF